MSDKKTIQRLLSNIQESLSDAGLDYMKESREVFADADAFDILVEGLLDGLEEGEAEGFRTLAENSRREFLIEANTSASLNAFAPMQMLLLRTIYPRLIASRAVETRTMKAPVEIFGWLKSYIRNASGDRVEVSQIDGDFTKGVDLSDTLTSNVSAHDLFDDHTGGAIARPLAANGTKVGTTVDRNFKVVSISATVEDTTGANGETVTVDLNLKPTVDGALFAVVDMVHPDDADAAWKVTVLGNLNRETGKLDLIVSEVAGADAASSTFALGAIKISAHASFEDNNTVLAIENEYKKDVIEVGDGEIIHSSIPYSYLKDMEALWNMDAMAEATAVIGGTFAQVSDVRVLNDLKEALEENPVENTVTWNSSYNSGGATAISRIDYNLELLERINMAIAICDEATQFNGNVSFTILANPVDAAHISATNISTGLFSGSIAKGGTVRNYVEGGLTTANGTATVLSSKLVGKGLMLVVPRSDSENELVYAKFDYSQIMLGHGQGYANPDNPYVTNVAMLNRCTRRGFRTHGITGVEITS